MAMREQAKMACIEATFKVVTPLFMSGAEQSQAELRLPSIKGALRFWWRALAWGRLNGDLAEIRRQENALFGSTATGQAAVLMKLGQQDIQTTQQSAQDWDINHWQSYVGYGLVDKKARPSRWYIQPGSTFSLLCYANKNISLNHITEALQAMSLLGGLGGRARKGWGSINLVSLSGSVPWSIPDSETSYQAAIDGIINTASPLPPYTAFSQHTQIEIGKMQRSSEAAHKYLANIYKEAVRGSDSKLEREQFGLPRGINTQDRRASPVFLHVHETASQRAIPVAAFLPAQFLETRKAPTGDDSQIKIFLDAVHYGDFE